jgi:hypothetical protein
LPTACPGRRVRSASEGVARSEPGRKKGQIQACKKKGLAGIQAEGPVAGPPSPPSRLPWTASPEQNGAASCGIAGMDSGAKKAVGAGPAPQPTMGPGTHFENAAVSHRNLYSEVWKQIRVWFGLQAAAFAVRQFCVSLVMHPLRGTRLALARHPLENNITVHSPARITGFPHADRNPPRPPPDDCFFNQTQAS